MNTYMERRDATKAAILCQLYGAQERLVASEIRAATGLTNGQVFAALNRLCRRNYVDWTETGEVSNGTVAEYGLAARGVRWLEWASRTGLLERLGYGL